jgi:hypothetical protein
MPPVRRGGLPSGAIWLIGLGIFALLGSWRPFVFLEGEATGGLFLIALSAFIFWRRYSAYSEMFPPGAPEIRWNTMRAARSAGTVFIVGVLTLLQGLHVARWSSTWPLLLIFMGVLLLAERSVQPPVTPASYGPGYGPGYAPGNVPPDGPASAPVPASDPNTPPSIVPRYNRPSNDLNDGEGR